MEGFSLEKINVPEEALQPTEEMQQDAVVHEMSGDTIDEVVDSILATASKAGSEAEGHEFLKQTLGAIEHYAQGHYDENRRELFPYWSSEKIKELHTALVRKMREALLAEK